VAAPVTNQEGDMPQARTAPDVSVYLEADARAELVDDDQGLALVLTDGHVEVVIPLPHGPAAWTAAKSIALRIEALEGELRPKAVGYRPEHGPHTGPCGWTP
jgi:hypothetical protein